MKSMYCKSILILVMGLTLSLTSCSSDENNPDNAAIKAEIQSDVTSDSWRITSFIDSGVDETQHFSGYVFTFNSNGTLNANNGTNDYNGTWSITDSSSDDDSQDDLDFNIFFNLTNDFEELNEDWHFVSHSASKIELIDISGGNGGTDTLTFEKN